VTNPTLSPVLKAARWYVRSGYSVIPVRLDGSKAPAINRWKAYQIVVADDDDLVRWFGAGANGIAIVHGQVSGHSEALDFETEAAYEEWEKLLRSHGGARIAQRHIVAVITPTGGRHVYYRCPDGVQGNQKLARFPDGAIKSETRGEGGYTLAPGSPVTAHPSKRPYRSVSGSFDDVPLFTADERALCLALARSCNAQAETHVTAPAPKAGAATTTPGGRPGDDYNQRATSASVAELLARHGWQVTGSHGEAIHLLRPGKTRPGLSATIGYVAPGVLYVFSSSAAPFEPDASYDAFAVLTLLEHGGDFSAAARALAEQGYGDPLPPSVRVSVSKYAPVQTTSHGQGAGSALTPSALTPKVEVALEEDSDDPFARPTPVVGPQPSYQARRQADDPLVKSSAPVTMGMAQTDLGNAERLVARHGGDIRHCPALGWLVWSGTHWSIDGSGEVLRRMKGTVRGILEEAAVLLHQAGQATDSDTAKHLQAESDRLKAFARRSEMEARIRAAISLAESEPGVYVAYEELDNKAWLLAVQNGTIDLHTGRLQAPRREDLLTRSLSVAYDPEATYPTWERFLSRTLPDPDVRAYIQRAAGYSLTGDVSEQCLFMLYGKGSNGKSTFLRVLLTLMGPLGKQAVADLLIARRAGEMKDEIAQLAGRRLVATIEVDQGKAMAEALVKTLTGGDRITARFLYRNSFEFEPTFKLWQAVNHKPDVKGSDHGLWRRIKLIPFMETISADEKDPDLAAKLTAELPGVLAWAVRGCLDWRSAGMREPGAVQAQTQEYRKESDVLGTFLTERCVLAPTARVRPAELYHEYVAWAEARRERPRSQIHFSRHVKECEGVESKIVRGFPYYCGVGLLAQNSGEGEPLGGEGEPLGEALGEPFARGGEPGEPLWGNSPQCPRSYVNKGYTDENGSPLKENTSPLERERREKEVNTANNSQEREKNGFEQGEPLGGKGEPFEDGFNACERWLITILQTAPPVGERWTWRQQENAAVVAGFTPLETINARMRLLREGYIDKNCERVL
jgi:putative DNA primase/helicase